MRSGIVAGTSHNGQGPIPGRVILRDVRGEGCGKGSPGSVGLGKSPGSDGRGRFRCAQGRTGLCRPNQRAEAHNAEGQPEAIGESLVGSADAGRRLGQVAVQLASDSDSEEVMPPDQLGVSPHEAPATASGTFTPTSSRIAMGHSASRNHRFGSRSATTSNSARSMISITS